MTTLCLVAAHLLLALWIGWLLLGRRTRDWPVVESAAIAILLGMYLETLGIATFVLAGLPLVWACSVVWAAIVPASWCLRHRIHLPQPMTTVTGWRITWFEGLLWLSIGAKLLFGGWQLLNLPVYYQDPLTHWSGRGRALYGQVNWSNDPASPAFLGYTSEHKHYPLLTPVWRGSTAVMAGGWNDVLARADGMAFFLITLGCVWSGVWRFSQQRWLAAAATFAVTALPLRTWHLASGNNDLAVEAYATAALCVLLRREWWLLGLLAAGAAWAKNDALFLVAPGVLLGLVLRQIDTRAQWQPAALWATVRRSLLMFALGFGTLAPWLLFQRWHAMRLTPDGNHLALHPEAFALMFRVVVLGPTHSVFWLCALVGIALTLRTTVKAAEGRALFGVWLFTLAGTIFVFCCTDAYHWLESEITVHRTMLQMYGTTTILVAIGVGRGQAGWESGRPTSTLSA